MESQIGSRLKIRFPNRVQLSGYDLSRSILWVRSFVLNSLAAIFCVLFSGYDLLRSILWVRSFTFNYLGTIFRLQFSGHDLSHSIIWVQSFAFNFLGRIFWLQFSGYDLLHFNNKVLSRWLVVISTCVGASWTGAGT
jgi:hypothetical protein